MQYLPLNKRLNFLRAETEEERALYGGSAKRALLNAFSGAKDAIVRQAQLLDSANAQYEADKKYQELVKSLMTDEEKRKESLRENLN